MAQGRKTGGRERGTPNRSTVAVADKLEAVGCDPIAGMAMLAMNDGNDPALRGRMYAELAGFIYPKRKALEVESRVEVSTIKGPDGESLRDRLEAALQTRAGAPQSKAATRRTAPIQSQGGVADSPPAAPRRAASERQSRLAGFTGEDREPTEPDG